MRFSKFFVYVICTLAIGSSNMKASHGMLERAPTPVARPAASPPSEPFIKTLFYTTGPQDRLIAENNLLHFESRNREDLSVLEDKDFFDAESVGGLPDSDISAITNIVFRIFSSSTNIATEFCMMPNEFIRDFERYNNIVWDVDHPYAVQSFDTLDHLKRSVSNLVKIINFTIGDCSLGHD